VKGHEVALDMASAALVVVGLAFICAGTVGLLRFPDVFARLHALTKADNVGLGFIVAGLALQAQSPFAAAQLLLIWILVLLAATTSCYLIARKALSQRPDMTGSQR
jgi:multicomponent Na+:H+ antiporter subunit G